MVVGPPSSPVLLAVNDWQDNTNVRYSSAVDANQQDRQYKDGTGTRNSQQYAKRYIFERARFCPARIITIIIQQQQSTQVNQHRQNKYRCCYSFGQQLSLVPSAYKLVMHSTLPTYMARGKGKTIAIKLLSSAGTGFFYTTRKNVTNTQHKMALVKFDPVVRQRVLFKEHKIK